MIGQRPYFSLFGTFNSKTAEAKVTVFVGEYKRGCLSMGVLKFLCQFQKILIEQLNVYLSSV